VLCEFNSQLAFLFSKELCGRGDGRKDRRPVHPYRYRKLREPRTVERKQSGKVIPYVPVYSLMDQSKACHHPLHCNSVLTIHPVILELLWTLLKNLLKIVEDVSHQRSLALPCRSGISSCPGELDPDSCNFVLLRSIVTLRIDVVLLVQGRLSNARTANETRYAIH
jgi:hypothetical protein